jgi:hypothetical protein
MQKFRLKTPARWAGAGLPILLLLLTALSTRQAQSSANQRLFQPASQPWLGGLLDENSANLSPTQQQAVQSLAEREADLIQRLEAESEVILADPALSLEQKRAWVHASRYNQRMEAILYITQRQLRQALGRPAYGSLVSQAEQIWQTARLEAQIELSTRWLLAGDGLAPLISQETNRKYSSATYPRSFEVYATRYDAGDRYIVALPDKCIKFANSGAMRCSDGYQYDQNYSVAISYKDKLVVATVLESGPWNIDDNYWAKSSDPQPRRMFADLPLGVPAAQAAFYNGYNNGLDQFGRKVTSPVAIDISYKVAKDLDLPGGNTRVTVSFLWTEGWDKPVKDNPSQPGEPTNPPVIGFARATANPDGSVIHEVQPGQTLTGIANVYQVELNELLKLNNLSMDSVIQPGDRILVVAGPPGTGTPAIPTTGTVQAADPTQSTLTMPGTPTPKFSGLVLTATLPADDLLLAATETAAVEEPPVPPEAEISGQQTTNLPGLTDNLVPILVVITLAVGALIAAWAWWKKR